MPSGDPLTHPADLKPRGPDGFAHFIPATLNRAPRFDQTVCGFFSPDAHNKHLLQRNIHCAATTEDGRYVLIRLIKKGDQGETHLRGLRRIASGGVALLGDNHALPVLREIGHGDMVFVVFPWCPVASISVISAHSTESRAPLVLPLLTRSLLP